MEGHFSQVFYSSRLYGETLRFEPTQANYITGSPSSKYEHRRAEALLRNILKYKDLYGKKPIVSLTNENERISIKTAYLT